MRCLLNFDLSFHNLNKRVNFDALPWRLPLLQDWFAFGFFLKRCDPVFIIAVLVGVFVVDIKKSLFGNFLRSFSLIFLVARFKKGLYFWFPIFTHLFHNFYSYVPQFLLMVPNFYSSVPRYLPTCSPQFNNWLQYFFHFFATFA